MTTKEYNRHIIYNKKCGNIITDSKRSYNIEEMVHDKAWANHLRMELTSEKHNLQELLDLFRDYFYRILSIMEDKEIPEIHDKQWELVKKTWSEFVYHYNANKELY